MDDLTEKISALLNSPDGMKKIQSTLSALGMGGDDGGDTGPAPARRGCGAPFPPAVILPAGTAAGFPTCRCWPGWRPLLSGIKNEDENTRLLNSLRPFLSGDREKRLDEAIRMLRMLKVMPLLRDQHLF